MAEAKGSANINLKAEAKPAAAAYRRRQRGDNERLQYMWRDAE